MPAAYPRVMRREFFDRVCAGESLREAGRQVGVSIQTGWQWWHDAGSMQLRNGHGSATGLAEPGDRDRAGGRGRRLSFEERLAIMRGLDQGLTQVEIARRLGRDPSVISRELKRNRNARRGLPRRYGPWTRSRERQAAQGFQA